MPFALRQFEYELPPVLDHSGTGGSALVDMSVAIVEEGRSKVKALVERAAIQTGSRMAAYQMVGEQINQSGAWVRAFVSGTPNAKPCVVLFNISAVYARVMTKKD